MAILLVALAITLFPWPIHPPEVSRWIIWNVGQGEWVTYESKNVCLHFDMGGEKFPAEAVRSACGEKENFVYFSHWDMDHVGFVQRAHRVLPRLCLGRAPLGPASPKKTALLEGLPACAARPEVTIWQPPVARQRRSSNESSQIYRVGSMLVTGDAPKKEEEAFVLSGSKPQIRWLVLGHHGSRTSTSEVLLRDLPHLRLTIASSRRAKYGHPHAEVEDRLRNHGIPLLTTEDWGHIVIEER